MPKTTKGADGGKRYPLNMRTTKETRDRLEAAAVASGRSLVQEVEARLEASFHREAVFGGPRLTRYAYLMASVFALSGQRSSGAADESWLDNDDAYIAAVTGVIDALLRDRSDKVAHYVLHDLYGRVATREAMKKEQANG
jgi:hypothetical protein